MLWFVGPIALVALIVCGESSNDSTLSYRPEDLLARIFNLNATNEGRANNRFRFDNDDSRGFVNFHPGNEYLAATDNSKIDYGNSHNYHRNYGEAFRYNPIGDAPAVGVQEKRRKQRVQSPRGVGSEYQSPYALNTITGGAAPPRYVFQYPGPVHRPSDYARPSLASEALSSVTEALRSVALSDDKQCVARLLCEAASGGVRGATGSLQSVAALQPLLALLSAYGGVSSNPLLVFGGAAFLGMSSKGNPAPCPYAYPQCPTDPEQLVHYLNNHKGGFFRFFNAPQRGQRILRQFYDQRSHNYHLDQRKPYKQYPHHHNNIIYQDNHIGDYNLHNDRTPYPYERDEYGLLNKVRFKNNEYSNESDRIEERVQNIPDKYLDYGTNAQNAKWTFPENGNHITTDNVGNGRGLKFPDNTRSYSVSVESKSGPRGFAFPGTRSPKYIDSIYQTSGANRNTKYNYDNYNNFDSNIYKAYNDNHNGYNKDQSIRTVYVVRGNGDPYHPEIINLAPGQSVY